jgi:GH15 family glucan-1,4-alpha-glucosidase
VVAGTNAPDRISVEPVSAVVAAGADLTDRAAGADMLAHWDRVVVHADWLADHWDRPEASVWDLGGPRRGWVAPRLAARRALSLAAASARRRNPLDLDAAGWLVAARQIERWLASKGVDAGGVLRPFAAADGGSAAGLDGGSVRPGEAGAGAEGGAGWTGSLAGGSDAALVRVAAWGPWPPDDVVVRNTIDRVIERNGDGPWIRPWPADLDDGRTGTEPASVTATLWVVRALALARRWEEAQERLDAVLTLAGPLGLLPESVDATTGDALGNRPSAAAHLALVEAALALGRSPA